MAEAIDISRYDVRKMAQRNHIPTEEWVGVTGDDAIVTSHGIVTCLKCGQVYPCATRKALDEYAENLRDNT